MYEGGENRLGQKRASELRELELQASQQNTHPRFHQKGQVLGRPQGEVPASSPLPPPPLLTEMLRMSGWMGHLQGDRQISWWVLWVCLTVPLSRCEPVTVSVSVHYAKGVLRGQSTLSSRTHSLRLLETLVPSFCRLAACCTLSVEMEQLPRAAEGKGILCKSPCFPLCHMSWLLLRACVRVLELEEGGRNLGVRGFCVS